MLFGELCWLFRKGKSLDSCFVGNEVIKKNTCTTLWNDNVESLGEHHLGIKRRYRMPSDVVSFLFSVFLSLLKKSSCEFCHPKLLKSIMYNRIYKIFNSSFCNRIYYSTVILYEIKIKQKKETNDTGSANLLWPIFKLCVFRPVKCKCLVPSTKEKRNSLNSVGLSNK